MMDLELDLEWRNTWRPTTAWGRLDRRREGGSQHRQGSTRNPGCQARRQIGTLVGRCWQARVGEDARAKMRLSPGTGPWPWPTNQWADAK